MLLIVKNIRNVIHIKYLPIKYVSTQISIRNTIVEKV